MRGLAAIGRDLPLWYLWLIPFSLLDLECNQLGTGRAAAVAAFLPSFLLVTVLFHLRGRSLPGWPGYGAASGLLLLLVLAGWTGPRHGPEGLLRLFEASALAGFLALALHARIVGGPRPFWLIYGTGLLYGLLLENAGVAMGFFAEEGYLLYVPGLPAPLVTGLGWCSVFYPLWWILGPVPAAPGLRAVAAAAIALTLDLHLDPVATAAGFWIWHPTLPPAVRGVPWVNFCAWLAAVLPFAWAAFHVTDRPGPTGRRLLRWLPPVLGAALLLVLLTTAILEAGAGRPSWRLLGRGVTALLPGG